LSGGHEADRGIHHPTGDTHIAHAMKTERVMKCIEALVALLDTSLLSRGFATHSVETPSDDKHFVRWERGHGWRTDVVRLSYPRRYLKESGWVNAHFSVNLATEDHIFTGIDVAEFVRKRGSNCYYLPTFFIFPLPWRYPAFRRRVARDMERALVWFDGYDTPQRCLEHLKSGVSALGDACPAGAYARALSFLEHEIAKATG
jgi:hypothetical protein